MGMKQDLMKVLYLEPVTAITNTQLRHVTDQATGVHTFHRALLNRKDALSKKIKYCNEAANTNATFCERINVNTFTFVITSVL
jgi:hypothetical protein